MISKMVFARSDANDVLAMSDATADAILADCTTTIIFNSAKTDDGTKARLKNSNVQIQFGTKKIE